MYTGGRLDIPALLDGLGSSFVITDRWVKGYPMNVTLHAPVEALLKIMREHGIHHEDIEEIDAGWQKVEPFLAKHKVSHRRQRPGQPALRPVGGRRARQGRCRRVHGRDGGRPGDPGR